MSRRSGSAVASARVKEGLIRHLGAVLVCGWALAVLALPAAGVAADQGSGAELKRIATLDDPTAVATAPGPSSRDLVFATERSGVVAVIADGRKRRRPFLDISDRVETDTLEQGLLALAFDPGYEENGRFYVYYTGAGGAIEVSRFRRSRNDPLRVKQDSERTILEIPHTASQAHNGGDLQFGPDGNLWISTGDGHPGCDPPENAQNRDSLLGKLLRIRPGNGGHTAPADNPFVAGPGADEIYAYGFRNPWRFSIDERSGTIAIGDVGQSTWEEINLVPLADARGANFGWDAYEGYVPLELPAACRSDTPTPLPADPIFPVVTFPHSSDDPREYVGCAVIGGVIVRDRRLGRLRGRYLFSDHCNGRLHALDPSDSSRHVPHHAVGIRVRWPTSIVAGRRNRIYISSRNGAVFRLDPVRRIAWTGPESRRADSNR